MSLYLVLLLKLLSFFVISLAWVEPAPQLLPTTPLWWSRRNLILGLQGLLLSAALHYLVLDLKHGVRLRPLLRGALEAIFLKLADFVGLSLQVGTEFNVPGQPVSGQKQSRRGGFTRQTGPQLWICALATTLWLVLLGCLDPLSSGLLLPTGRAIGSLQGSSSISHSFPSELEAKVYLAGAGEEEFVFEA